MAGMEGSTKRGMKASTRRRQGRRTAGEEGCFSLGQCTGKHMSAEEAATGEEEEARFPKAGECEPLDMFPERERERSSLMEPMQMIFAPMLRERVKASLLTFPEVAALDTEQLEVAVDRIIGQSRPETASPTSPGMCRLSDQDIAAFFYHKTEIPTIHDLAPAGGVFPAGWIEERRKQLDGEVQPGKKKFGQDLDVLLAKIRVDLLTKGYVEVPEMYFEEDTPVVQAARMEQATKEYTGVAGPDDEEWWLDDTAVVLTKLIIESS